VIGKNIKEFVMNDNRRRRSLLGPLILIALGVVFLLNNMGILSWNVWEVIFRLWPILVIAIGLDLLLGRRSAWGAVLAFLITLAILLGALWLFESDIGRNVAGSAVDIRQDLQGASEAVIVLDPAVGSVQVDALGDSANLLEGVVRPANEEEVATRFSLEGDTATFVVERAEPSFGPFLGDINRPRWEIGLARGIPLELQVDHGVGQLALDLDGLTLRALRVNLGLGQTTVTLPNRGRFEAVVKGAIGQMTIVVPDGLAVRIMANTGVATRSVPDGYRREGDVYTSPGYDAADDRVDLAVSQVIGSLVIRQSGGE
jgi:hypothetical protein